MAEQKLPQSATEVPELSPLASVPEQALPTSTHDLFVQLDLDEHLWELRTIQDNIRAVATIADSLDPNRLHDTTKKEMQPGLITDGLGEMLKMCAAELGAHVAGLQKRCDTLREKGTHKPSKESDLR